MFFAMIYDTNVELPGWVYYINAIADFLGKNSRACIATASRVAE